MRRGAEKRRRLAEETGNTEQGRRVNLQNWGRWAVTAILAAGAVYLVFRLQKILLLFYLALLLGLAINPLILWLERRRISRGLAVGGLALIFIASIVTAGFLIAPPAAAQAQNLIDSYPEYQQRAQTWINGMFRRYPELQPEISSGSDIVANSAKQAGGVLRQLGQFALGFGGVIFSGLLLFFLLIFGLINPKPMAGTLFDLTPPSSHDRVERTLSRIQEKVVAWAGGTFILMAIVGILVWISLALLKVPNALLFGIIAAIGEGIPNIGPILSAIPPIAVMLLTDPMKAIGVLVVFLVVQQLENSIFVPMVMGNRLNVHPWGLIFMILVMGELFGVIGVFLATPTAAILGVIYEELIPKPGRSDSVPTHLRVGRVVGGSQGDMGDTC